jgi:hypothetical protein
MVHGPEDEHPERVWLGVLALVVAGLVTMIVAVAVSETGRAICRDLWALLRHGG